jgi:peptide/nickel transport system permease protein
VKLVRKYRLATVGAVLVIGFLLTGLLAPWLAPQDPNKINPRDSLAGPGRRYLLGADYAGRDLLSRIIFGARVASTMSLSSVGVGMLIGVIAGLVAGWWKRLEGPIMRVIDVLLCLPGIVIALLVVTMLGSGLENVIVAIATFQVPQFGRLTHGLVCGEREMDYVIAARSIGASSFRIVFRHILPNITGPLIVQVTIMIPAAILTLASLSFLGLGVAPPTPTWGGMLQDSLSWARLAPHVAVFPGLALTLVVFGFNTLGDGLRSALDPKTYRIK